MPELPKEYINPAPMQLRKAFDHFRDPKYWPLTKDSYDFLQAACEGILLRVIKESYRND